MPKGLVTIRSAGEILRVSVETLRNWDKSGRLKASRNKNGYRVYNISELEKFAESSGLRRGRPKLKLLTDN
ncbi:MAG TPA: MerR family DNA-binding transcriptional regulator [Candidatus Paceibacterota bacterium]